MKPSLSSILSVLFIIFIAHSIWNLIGIFRVPRCKEGDACFKYYLNSKPDLDLFVFISDNSRSGNTNLILSLKKFDYSSTLEMEITLDLTRRTRNNGSLFIHSLIVPSGPMKDDMTINELVNLPDSTYLKHRLTKYILPASGTFNLLHDKSSTTATKPVTHLNNRFSLMLCAEELSLSRQDIPIEILGYVRLNSRKEILPLIEEDLMQTRLRNYVEITPDTERVNFIYAINPISIGKMRFLLQIDATFHQFVALGFTDKDLDEVKGVFADTNLYLLCATVTIGSIHLLLDFLSFKNDISFWKSQTSMAGLSTRSLIWRAFSQNIVFLYLLDEGTSLLVLIPSGIATLIEFWKVSKVLKTSISWRGLNFNKDNKESEEEKKTREYDEECMKYLSYLLYPLCIGAAIYSLLYQPHRSWYSWTINSLVNGVYAFGFLFMLPQLFINYRLKSVAALPWRAFTYRAFNTFIDDIFAFIISMPTAHRIACFRDDVVFLIYLYQRWLYPVDKTRMDDTVVPNEVHGEEKKKEK